MKRYIYQIQKIDLIEDNEKLRFLGFDEKNNAVTIEIGLMNKTYDNTFLKVQNLFLERFIGYELDFTSIIKSSKRLDITSEKISFNIYNELDLELIQAKEEDVKNTLLETNDIEYLFTRNDSFIRYIDIEQAKKQYNNVIKRFKGKEDKYFPSSQRLVVFNIETYNDLEHTDLKFLEEISINGKKYGFYICPTVQTDLIEDNYVLEDYLSQDIISVLEEKVVIETNIKKTKFEN